MTIPLFGAMSKHRCAAHKLVCSELPRTCAGFCQLLGGDASSSSWNYCAPVARAVGFNRPWLEAGLRCQCMLHLAAYLGSGLRSAPKRSRGDVKSKGRASARLGGQAPKNATSCRRCTRQVQCSLLPLVQHFEPHCRSDSVRYAKACGA